MNDGIVIFASQVSIIFSFLLVALIYGLTIAFHILAYGYDKLRDLYHTSMRYSHSYRQRLQDKETVRANNTRMMGV